MELPALLPQELNYASVAENDQNLSNLLIKIPQDFILFFEYACDDETWSGNHPQFMKEVIQWMTVQFFEDKFPFEFAHRAVLKMREHYEIIKPYVLYNLTFFLNGSETGYEASSLMWGGSSDALRNLIRQECRDKNKKKMKLENLTREVFVQVEEYIKTGKVADLWRKEKEEVTEVLYPASDWGLVELMEMCQDILKRYISRGNVIDLLLKSHEEKWLLLKNTCIDFINTIDSGVKFEKRSPESLVMEFLDFSPKAMAIFEETRFEITHLICGRDLPEKPGFSDVINRAPKMICLELTGSRNFSDRLLDIPKTLEELNVSKCEWINNKTLKTLTEVCPNLVKISLANNSHLSYSAWSILKDFKKLEKVDISRCTQIKDDDFKIIIQACRNVTHFYLEECSGLSDNAFFELGKNIPRLSDVDVSRTNITDSGLIDLMMRCKSLITLNVSRCPHITDKGILEAIENAPNLKSIDLTKNNVSKSALHKIKELRPFIKINA